MTHDDIRFAGIAAVSSRLMLAAFLAIAATPQYAYAQKTDLVIGQSAPLTGPYAGGMSSVIAGEKLAFEEVNKRGGIYGRKISLITLDDAFDPKRSLENAKNLAEQENAVALFGFVGTAQTATVLPYINERKIPLISVYSGSPALRIKANPYFFTTQASYADELVKITRNLVAIQNSRIAIVYQDNDFGKLLQPLAEKIVVAEGGTMAISRPLAANGSDAAAVAQSLIESKPQSVILLVAGPPVVNYVKANKAILGVPLYTLSLSINAPTIKALGDDARGVAVARATPYPWNGITALPKNFGHLMKATGKEIDYDHYVGYINALVLIEALRKAGKNITPETVTQSMEKLNNLDLGGQRFNFSPQNHHGSNFVEITVIGPNGKFIR